MISQDIALKVVDVLNANGVEYMLVGSLSTNFHSIVRSTKDADIVIQSNLIETGRLLAREYPELKMDPQLGFESVTGSRKLLLREAAHEFVIELFALTDDPHDQERFRRRARLEWLGRPTWVATAEDAIITKLRWSNFIGREKDVYDARNVIASTNERIDWPYVEHWCDVHQSRQTLERLRRELFGTS